MSIAVRQIVPINCGGTKTSTATGAWGFATLAGSKLFVFLMMAPTAVNAPDFVSAIPPTGWSWEVVTFGGDGGANTDPRVGVVSIENASSRSGTENFGLSAVCSWIGYLIEVTGQSNPAADKIATANNSVATTVSDSGTTAVISQANELGIAVHAVKNQIRSLSSPTNGYSVQSADQTSVATASQGISVEILTKIISAATTQGTASTINTSSNTAGVIVTVKEATGGTVISDSATVALSLAPSGADISQKVDSNVAILGLVPSETDIKQNIEAGTVSLGLVPSSIQSFQGVESATTVLNLSPNDVDVAQYVDIGTVRLNLNPSNNDVANVIESNTIPINVVPMSSDLAGYVEASTGLLNLVPSSLDAAVFSDSTVLPLVITPSGTEFLQTGGFDASTLVIGLIPSSSDILQTIESATINLVLTPSGLDIGQRSDADTGIIGLIPVGIDVPTYSDSAQTSLSLIPSGSEQIAGSGDEAVVILRLIPWSLEIKLVAILTFTAFQRWAILDPSNRYDFKGYNRWRNV